MSYTTQKRVDGGFDDVVERTVEALSEEGFGVLCDIDVQETFAEKLDLDEAFRNYRILGACNPGLARQGLEAELDLGTLLPCNVIVYEDDNSNVVVSAVNPETLVSLTDNPELDPISEEVAVRFERVLDAL